MKTTPRRLASFMARVDVTPDCWSWTDTTNGSGYGSFGSHLAHRWIHTLMTGDDPEVVRHTCGNTLCVKPTHLLSGTQSQNMQDKFFDGTQNTQKLDVEAVRDIRARFVRRNQRRSNAAEIARDYNITPKYVTLVAEGKRLSYVG